MLLFLEPGASYGPAAGHSAPDAGVQLLLDPNVTYGPNGSITVLVDETEWVRPPDVYGFAYLLTAPPAEPVTFDVAPGATLTLEAGTLLLSGSLWFSGW